MHDQAACYLCDNRASTRDHVPARSLFPQPRPDNLITVPCCAHCNTAYSRDEEYFRNNLSMVADYRHDAPIWEATRRSYHRRPSIRTEIISRMTTAQIGLAPQPILRFDVVRTNRVLVKFAKGLAFHHSGQRLLADVSADVYQDSRIPLILADTLPRCSDRGSWGDVFSYVGAMAFDAPGEGMWMMTFYSSVLFLVRFYRNAASARAEPRA